MSDSVYRENAGIDEPKPKIERRYTWTDRCGFKVKYGRGEAQAVRGPFLEQRLRLAIQRAKRRHHRELRRLRRANEATERARALARAHVTGEPVKVEKPDTRLRRFKNKLPGP